jgi:hypothetical protein
LSSFGQNEIQKFSDRAEKRAMRMGKLPPSISSTALKGVHLEEGIQGINSSVAKRIPLHTAYIAEDETQANAIKNNLAA